MFWTFSWEKAGRFVKTEICVSRRSIFLLKHWKYPQKFLFLLLTVRNSLRKVFRRLMKSVLVFSSVTFWRKLVFRRIFFSFWDFESKFYALWYNNFSEVEKVSFNVFAGVFLKKCFFSWRFLSFLHFEQNVLNLLVWKSRRICENRTLRVRKINFLAEILKYPQIFIFFYLQRKTNCEKLLAVLWKVYLSFLQ